MCAHVVYVSYIKRKPEWREICFAKTLFDSCPPQTMDSNDLSWPYLRSPTTTTLQLLVGALLTTRFLSATTHTTEFYPIKKIIGPNTSCKSERERQLNTTSSCKSDRFSRLNRSGANRRANQSAVFLPRFFARSITHTKLQHGQSNKYASIRTKLWN